MIQEIYPEHTSVQAYTDGSANNAVRNVGSVICILYLENYRETRYIPPLENIVQIVQQRPMLLKRCQHDL